MVRYPAIAAWLFGFVMVGSVLSASSGLAQEPVVLKSGAGMEETSVSCGICHSQKYIPMNSVFLTGDAWKAEVNKMRTVFGAPIDDDTAATIISYLTAQYGVPAGGAAKP
jgi:mono/diheme cytochrome c family protein